MPNKLKAGDRVSLRTSTGSVEGTITSIGELQNDPSKGAAKSVRFSADDPSKLTPGQSASITSKGNTSTTLAVPTTAVRQDSQGTYVLVEKGGSSTSTSKDAPATERVNVEVYALPADTPQSTRTSARDRRCLSHEPP